MTTNLFDMLIAYSKTKTAKQQRIIETAIRLFAEKGYANTSTAEIAKMAEVSEGTIFKHYGTKDKLLLSIILPFVKESLPSIANEVFSETLTENTTSFEQFLSSFLRNRVEFITENKQIFKVFIKEILYKDELKKEVVPYFAQNMMPLLTNVIEEFKDRGEIVDKPTDQIINTIATLVGGFFVSRFVLFERDSISEEDIEYTVRFAMNGIRNPLFQQNGNE